MSVTINVGGSSMTVKPLPQLLEVWGRIDRQTKSTCELLLYALLLILFDVGKLITSYALKYFNDDVYPVEQTLIVFLTEDAKLLIMLAYLLYLRTLKDISLSLKFAVPSVLYAINNNLFLYAFHYTTPAVWTILTQSRIIFTALIYRLAFKKHITRMQWLSLCVLAFAISLTQMPRATTSEADGIGGLQHLQPMAVAIAALCSVISVAAGVFIEYLFKNDRRPFGEQQLQLCLFSALASLLLYRLEAHSTAAQPQLSEVSAQPLLPGDNRLTVLLVVCVLLGAVSGLVTGIVIKKLDNIVKIYSQSLCGVLNAIVCMIIFPAKFSLDWHYVAALMLVIVSIIAYELNGVNSVAQGSTRDSVAQNSSVKSSLHNGQVTS